MGRVAKIAGRGGSPRSLATRRAAAVLKVAPASILNLSMDARGHLIIDRIVKRLGMTRLQFGGMIGVSAETLTRSARAAAPKTQERVREALEVLDRVKEWAGGEMQATAWYKSQPIPAFGGRTAESIVKSGEATVLRDYLDHVATGGFS